MTKQDDLEKKATMPSILADTPYYWGIATWLNGDADLDLDFSVPRGVLRFILIWSHTSETNHEDVYIRIYLDGAQILPMAWSNDARAYIPAPPTGCVLKFDMNHPITSDYSMLRVELNQAPSNGLSVLGAFEPISIERRRHKGMIRSYVRDIE